MSLNEITLADQSASYCRFGKVFASHSAQGECQFPLGVQGYPQKYCESGKKCSSTLDCTSGGNLSAYCDATHQCSNYMSGRRGTIFDLRLAPSFQK